MMPLTEETLARASKGDQVAFAEIVRQHQAMVYSMAYHFLQDGPAAEELAQDVFLQLYQNLPKMESPSHVIFWLRRVTGHRCIDWARRQNPRPHMSLDEAPELTALGTPEDSMQARKLRRLVAALPKKTRIVVTLRYQEDLQPAEIAEILEMPVNTVKSQLHRALEILHEKLMALEKLTV